MTPSDLNASRYQAAQAKLETFYETKTKGIRVNSMKYF